jgi:SHS2 domain-containing protein
MDRGRRFLPHTADVIIEAWGDGPAACFEEAATALCELFAVAGPASGELPVRVEGRDREDLLVALLDEIIFLLDTADRVPIGLRLDRVSDTEAAGSVLVADPDDVEAAGVVPKAVSRSGLAVVEDSDGWRATVIVDV